MSSSPELADLERFAKIFHAASTMFAFTEPTHGRILDVNEAWLRTAKLPRDEAVGKTGRELGLWANSEDRARVLERLDATGRVHGVEVDLVMGGRRFPALVSVEHIEMRGERYILWELHDLTERRRTEEEKEQLRAQLLQAQKMESVGQLAGGIAHDFNNLLSVILGFTGLALRQVDPGAPAHEHLAQVQRAGQRAAELTKQLLTFSRKQVVQARVLDPVAVLHDMCPMLRRLIGESIELAFVGAPGTGRIKVDPTHLEQAIMNLVVNARDAMPGGGTLTVEASNVDIDGAYGDTHLESRTGPHVLIAVSDTGVGMDSATRAHAFEPFFTTKGPGHGTGLGLSTVYGIVKQAGGWVWLYSEPGHGTTFKLYFPRSQEDAAGPPPPRKAHTPPRAGTTVLLVEDEPQLRLLMQTVLEGAGYVVIVASEPLEAIALAGAHGGEIELLLTDVVMPHMNGRQLADRLGAQRPSMRVLFVSGYTENTVLDLGAPERRAQFLSKPITSDALLSALATALDAG